jgi:hypothetical protein
MVSRDGRRVIVATIYWYTYKRNAPSSPLPGAPSRHRGGGQKMLQHAAERVVLRVHPRPAGLHVGRIVASEIEVGPNGN